jgi:hypothetical protein
VRTSISTASQAGLARARGLRVPGRDGVRRFWIATAALTVVSAMTAPSASAAYYSWGVLYAYEGSTLVAEGKGVHGTDLSVGVFGGHVTSYDPRPGGSPAFANIAYFYYTDAGTAATGGNLRGSNNYEARWKDQAKYQTLNSAYAKVGTIPKACQDDALQPDACKNGSEVKQATH